MKQPLEFFVDLETRVWEALATGDPDADRELLSSDFVGVYPSGFADLADHAGQLAGGPTMAEYAISDARLIRVAPSNVMLCYRADYRSIRDGVPGADEAMYISSLWVERDGRWWNTFSQDTPTTPARSM